MKLGRFALNPRFSATASTTDDALSPPFGGSDDDLRAYNSLAHRIGVARTRENAMVRVADVISSAPLKNGLCLRAEGVEAIARLGFDTALQANHDLGMFTSGFHALPLARAFRTQVVRDGDVSWARFWFGYPRTSLTEEVVERQDGGAIAELSASFYYRDVTCSICGRSLDDPDCQHQPMATYDGKTCLGYIEDPAEYVETSLVWQGMANDTRLHVAAARFDSEWKKRGRQGDPVDDLFGLSDRDLTVASLFME